MSVLWKGSRRRGDFGVPDRKSEASVSQNGLCCADLDLGVIAMVMTPSVSTAQSRKKHNSYSKSGPTKGSLSYRDGFEDLRIAIYQNLLVCALV